MLLIINSGMLFASFAFALTKSEGVSERGQLPRVLCLLLQKLSHPLAVFEMLLELKFHFCHLEAGLSICRFEFKL